MALIKCPECGKEISDRADVCIHCGCPLEKNKEKSVIPDVSNVGKMNLYSASEEKILLECDSCGKVYSYNASVFSKITYDYVTTNADIGCKHCCSYIPQNTNITIKNKEYKDVELSPDIKSILKAKSITTIKSAPDIKCPTCSSKNVTRISSGEKITNVALFGLFGNKRKMQFKCNDCKYMW